MATFVVDSHIGRDLLHITQDIARAERLWHVHITEPSSSLAFLNSHWPAKNIQLNSDMVYPHCPYNAHFSTIVGYGLLASVVICAHHLAVVRRGPPLSTSTFKKRFSNIGCFLPPLTLSYTNVSRCQTLPTPITFGHHNDQSTLSVALPYRICRVRNG